MSDNPHPKTWPDQGSGDRLVGALATRALSVVAAKPDRGPRVLNKVFKKVLDDAARAADPKLCNAALIQMLRAGISAEDIADCYIPSLARDMGDAWGADTMSFAEVTIGVSRLQGMLRDLGPEWQSDKGARPNAPTVLLIVPQAEFHTLGASVLCGQLRRLGVSVRLSLDTAPEDVSMRVRAHHFDAVMISATKGISLEALRKLVEAARTAQDASPPVVIGGTLLELHDNVADLTGSDFATNDLNEAITLCGLTIAQRPVAQTAQGR